MTKRGSENLTNKFSGLFLLKAKKGEINVRTIISLVLVIVFFALIAYLFIQKFPAP